MYFNWTCPADTRRFYVEVVAIMRRILVMAFLGPFVLAAMVVPLSTGVGSVQAHVHGITPLFQLSCVVDNAVTGANQTDNTAASAANSGPIAGLIPRDVGNAPLTVGDGGFAAPVPACGP